MSINPKKQECVVPVMKESSAGTARAAATRRQASDACPSFYTLPVRIRNN